MSIKINHIIYSPKPIEDTISANLKSLTSPSVNIVEDLGIRTRKRSLRKASIDDDIGCISISDEFHVVDGQSIAVRYSSSLELQTIRAGIYINIENLGIDFVVTGDDSENLLSIPVDVSHA